MTIKHQIGDVEKQVAARWCELIDSLIILLTPDEREAMETALDLDLAGEPIPPELARRADAAFLKLRGAASPQERRFLGW